MPAKVDQWITIRDFRPGIKGRTFPSTVTRIPGAVAQVNFVGFNSTYGSQPERVVEVEGVAAADNTYACRAFPDGSLGPMPSNDISNSMGASTPFDPTLATTGRLTISGYKRIGPVQFGDEVHVAFEAAKAADGKRYYYWTRVREFAASQVDILKSFAPTNEAATVSSNTRPTYFDTYRAASGTDATVPGVPGIVAGWFAGSGGGTVTNLWSMFPDPGNSTTDTPLALTTTNFFPGPALSHQGRAVLFNNISYNHGANSYVWTHNEDIWFTKANLTTLQTTTEPETFGMEDASGYMMAVSNNHQELLAVKLQGGGMVIRGDLADPTVLRLPGLPNVTRHIGCVCPQGTIMLDALQTGAWLWTGGESAQNISAGALDGTDFQLGLQGNTVANGNVSDFLDYTGQCAFWYDWVVFPNNWAWNWQDGSWWRLSNPASTAAFMHYSVQIASNPRLYAAPAYISHKTDNFEYGFNYSKPARTYRWTSLPITLGPNQMMMLRDLVLVATGVGTVTVTFTKFDGTTEAHALTINSTTVPAMMRDNCDVNSQSIQVQIDVSASSDAVPVIHELRLGFQADKHYPNRTQ